MRLLVTGGCGFVGRNFIRYVLDHYQPEMITNVDVLVRPDSQEASAAFASRYGDRYESFKCDITDVARMNQILSNHSYFAVVNFAEENRGDFASAPAEKLIHTNILGVSSLLSAAREHGVKRFVQISTAEVYGRSAEPLRSTEHSILNPVSTYAASKAAADLLVRSAYQTYGQDVVVTRCSKNYGPHQQPEALIPSAVINAMSSRSLVFRCEGLDVNDWIHVEDHCAAVFDILMQGRAGEIYNVGADVERKTVEVIRSILFQLGKGDEQIRFVPDRGASPGRYVVDSNKLRREIGWKPLYAFETRLAQTIEWYRGNRRGVERGTRKI